MREIEAAGGSGWFQAVDVANRESLGVLRDAVLERSGAVDILVNGAGVNSPTPFWKSRMMSSNGFLT